VSEGRVFVLSGRDMLACLDAESGEALWSVDLHGTYGSHWDMFGVSESVLLVDGKIIVTPGGEQTTIMALDEATGEPVWKSETLGAQRSNMSPMLIRHAGEAYIIASTRTHVISVDPATGEIYWKYHYNELSEKGDNSTIISNTPTYADSCLWLTSGWDKESVMLEIAPDGRSVTEKFKDRTFDNQNHGVVLLDGYVYGSNFTDRNMGKWVCMNFATGEIIWIGEFHNKGPVIAADGMLYIYEEKRGHLGLVKATPEAFEVISSFRVTAGTGPHWARPSIYDGRLMVRHGQTLSVYQIKKE
jgi:outer membrane protein assembly factor BamB